MRCPDCDAEILPGQDDCPECGSDLMAYVSPPRQGRLHELILEDPLTQLNAPAPILLEPTDTVADAIERMRKRRFGSVMVVDSEHRLQGIFTERDVLKLTGRGDALRKIAIKDVMTPNPKTLREEDTIALALNRMAVGGYRHIPIVRDRTPVGFTSIRGILTYVAMNAL